MPLQLLLFGGHGTGGWLSRYDIYYNDCIILDRGVCLSSSLLNHPVFQSIGFGSIFNIACLNLSVEANKNN